MNVPTRLLLTEQRFRDLDRGRDSVRRLNARMRGQTDVQHLLPMWRVSGEKIIAPEGPYALCPECGYQHPFRQLPLLMVSGASGVGKSAICCALVGKISEAVLLDSDMLWRRAFDTPENKYREYFEMWLRVCKNIAQSGRPVVLFGAGMGVPENIEPCLERRYFSGVYYLALTCDPCIQTERLQQRPAWHKRVDPEYLETHLNFNQWFRENARKVTPNIDLLDISENSSEETCERVAHWIRAKLGHVTEW